MVKTTTKPRRQRPLVAPPTPVPPAPDETPQAAPTNNPPPIAEWGLTIDDLFAEAQNWCDGEPISTEGQAEEITKLIGMLEKAMKGASAAADAEKKPLHDAWKAKIAEWKPLLEKCEKAIRAAKRAMTPWLEIVAAENRRKQEEASKAAEAAAARLREQAIASRESSDLRDDDVREQLERDAEEAAKAARIAASEKAVVRGGGKTVTLRDVWLVAINDRKALLQHYMRLRPDDLEAWLYDQARRDVREGARHLPGCNIWSEKKAV